MFDKYLYALGRGVRGAKKAFDEARAQPQPDPAQQAVDITPPPVRPSSKPELTPPPQGWAGSEPLDAMLARAPLSLGERCLVMGIVNVTPDSFSDGGKWFDARRAFEHAMSLLRDGADILDIGGESTRPGATPVDADEERARVIPVLRALASQTSAPLSIDTMKASVAAAAVEAGANILNDVWGFQRDAEMARVAAANDVWCVLMHNRETDDPSVDMYAEVRDFLRRSADLALGAGVAEKRIILDPGIGFGKTPEQGFELVRRLPALRRDLGFPILLGVSRKRLIGAATGRAIASERTVGSVAAGFYGAMHGADILRVHDVRETVDALKVLRAIETSPGHDRNRGGGKG
jgi:dihydropteroate synthase